MKKIIPLGLGLGLMIPFFTSCNDEGSNSKKEPIAFIDPKNMDTSISPGENFFYYANGAWLKNTEIPSDQTRWGSFEQLRDRTNNDLHKLLENSLKKINGNDKEAQVGKFYKSGMDTETINALGMKPLEPYLTEIDQITDKNSLLKEISRLHTLGISQLFNFYIAPDDKDVDVIVPQLFQGGLGLSSKEDYFKTDARSEEIREKYKKYITELYELLGDKENAQKHAETIFNLEKKLAHVSLTPTERRDPQRLYNKYNINELNKISSNIPWKDVFQDLKFHDIDYVIIGMPDFFKELGNLLENVSIDTWKTYLKFHVASDMAPYLSEEFEALHFDFYSRTLTGQKEKQERWKRVMHTINSSIGENLAQLYVEKHFSEAAKERMIELVDNLQNTFEERIENLDWMSDVTKKKAISKLHTFTKKIGFPDKWKDYSSIEIKEDTYLENILHAAAFEYDYQINKLGKEVNKAEWLMLPNIVNAYYYPTFNEIVFPAAILQFPFFDFEADDAINYGGIGAVIGHEMTHGFDDQGAQFDAQGYLRNWWTEEDERLFKEKTNVIREQFNNYKVLDSIPVNGSLTLGENIADLGGVTIAYYAFKKTKQGQSDEKIDGFTPDQRFFLSWAQIWRGKSTAERAQRMILLDPHSPEEFRCNGPLSNFEPFYEAFGIKEGDAMYRSEDIRAKVW